MIKTVVLVLVAAIIGGTGHVMLAKGMRQVGDLIEAPAHRMGGMVSRVVRSPWVLLGVALQATFFSLYLTLLSRADVSLVLPMTAVDYIVVALLAQHVLGEPVTAVRWAGIGLIITGVFLVSRS
ncbi:MAG TPA: EamA family transporter [Candidatus Binatia bacterium]|nr:EamA family transporter [Candidatus Binatia bacterium]